MLLVPLLIVKLTGSTTSHESISVEVPNIINVLEPMFKVLVPVANTIRRAVTELLLVVTVPLVRVSVPYVGFRVSAVAKDQVLAAPLNVTAQPSTTPLVVIVPLLVNVIVPEADHVVVADHVIPPAMVSVPVELNVNEDPVVVMLLQFSAPDNDIVPAPDALSKNTSSAVLGTLAPPDPPLVADQLVVELVSQVPVPPTQYLVAITQRPQRADWGQ